MGRTALVAARLRMLKTARHSYREAVLLPWSGAAQYHKSVARCPLQASPANLASL